MDIWLAYAPVKNNPEDAAKVSRIYMYTSKSLRLTSQKIIFCGRSWPQGTISSIWFHPFYDTMVPNSKFEIGIDIDLSKHDFLYILDFTRLKCFRRALMKQLKLKFEKRTVWVWWFYKWRICRISSLIFDISFTSLGHVCYCYLHLK